MAWPKVDKSCLPLPVSLTSRRYKIFPWWPPTLPNEFQPHRAKRGNFEEFSFQLPAFEKVWTSCFWEVKRNELQLLFLPKLNRILQLVFPWSYFSALASPSQPLAVLDPLLPGRGRGRGGSGMLAPALALTGNSRNFVQHTFPSPPGRRSVC